MSLKEKIDAEIIVAMKAQKKGELIALRGIKSMILLAETEKGAGALSEEIENKILMKAYTQRKESEEIFRKEGRNDLASKEQLEMKIIAQFLPPLMSEEELTIELKKIIAQVGATSVKDIGKVMGITTKALAGKAEGKLISEITKNLLG